MNILKMSSKLFAVIVFSFFFQSNVYSKSIRVVDLDTKKVQEILSSSDKDFIVEFRQGDLVPLGFVAKGDLFESQNNLNHNFLIKKDFFIKIGRGRIQISFNGNNYIDLKDALTGQFSLGTEVDENQIPGVISALLLVYLK